MLSHGDTPICQTLVYLCQRAKISYQTQYPWCKYNFDIVVKGQGHTEFMNVRDTSYHGDTLTCKTIYDFVKGQKS